MYFKCQVFFRLNQALEIITCFWNIGAVFPAIFILGASYAGYDKLLVVVLFTLAMGFLGNFYPGLKVNALDLSPNYAGSLMGMNNQCFLYLATEY